MVKTKMMAKKIEKKCVLVADNRVTTKSIEEIEARKNKWQQKRKYYDDRIETKENLIENKRDQIQKLKSQIMRIENEIRGIEDDRYYYHPQTADIQYLKEAKKYNATHFRTTKPIGKDSFVVFVVEFKINGKWFFEETSWEDTHDKKLRPISELNKEE